MIYLLKVDIPELLPQSGEEPLRVLKAIDSFRAKTAERMIKNPKGRAACMGAGLLLQKAVRDYAETKNEIGSICIETPRMDELMPEGAESVDFRYRFGEQGKPYFEDGQLPFFNISHAGGYVAVAVSDTEVGIDIQNIRNNREKDMAERFFSPRESAAVKEDPERRVFYRLWARKEALGKCTGEGVRPYLDTDVYELDSFGLSDYEWFEKIIGEDLYLCVCRLRKQA